MIRHEKVGKIFFNKGVAILVALFLFSTGGCLSGCKNKTGMEPMGKTIEVEVCTITAKDTPLIFEYIGQTESSHMVEIRARVEGFLDKQLYNDGAFVKAGQPMFQIDPKPFEASLEEAKGQLSQQEAKLFTATANLKRIKPLSVRKTLMMQPEVNLRQRPRLSLPRQMSGWQSLI